MFIFQKNNGVVNFCILFLAFVSIVSSPAADDVPKSVFSIETQDTEVSMVAKRILLKDLIERIKNKLSVDIKGLTVTPDKIISFSYKGKSPEIVLRQLLRHLGEKNFAYEFSNDKLVRITVFPEGTQTAAIRQEPSQKNKKDTISVVEIVEVLEETQAEALGLKKGDYIYEYNGQRIREHEALVEATFQSNGSKSVSMVIIRKDRLNRINLEGGFIGVHVRTKLISKKELPLNAQVW